MNDAHAIMFGYAVDELVGRPWTQLYTSNMISFIENDVFPVVLANGSWRGELEGCTRSGRSVMQEVVLSLRSEGGLICATRNIEERIARQREIRQLEYRLRQSERETALLSMGSSIAHDFNNLIAAISGYAVLLQSDPDQDSVSHERAGRILEAVEQASDLVRSLESFKINPDDNFHEFDLIKILRSSLAIADSIRPSGIRVETDLPVEALVFGNEVLVSRALINIAKNAFEAMQSVGTLKVRVGEIPTDPFSGRAHRYRVGDHGRQTQYILEITDTGPGISPQTLKEVFTPYTTTKAALSGSGLGLLSVQALADKNFAAVELDSMPGCGVCVRILFFEPPQRSSAHMTPITAKSANTGKTISVLLVDDNPSLGNIMVEILTRQGFVAALETNAPKALEQILSDTFAHDIVVTDLTMPYLNGDQLAHRAKQKRPLLPIILYSGQAGYIPKDAIYADVLTKPISPDRLRDSIEKAIRTASAGPTE